MMGFLVDMFLDLVDCFGNTTVTTLFFQTLQASQESVNYEGLLLLDETVIAFVLVPQFLDFLLKMGFYVDNLLIHLKSFQNRVTNDATAPSTAAAVISVFAVTYILLISL